MRTAALILSCMCIVVGPACDEDSPDPNPTITLTSPAGGETLVAGTTFTVAWASAHFATDVTIEISLDDGATWTDLAAAVANDGTENVVLPRSASASCMIRVSDAVTTVPTDTCDTAFSLVLPQVSISGPATLAEGSAGTLQLDISTALAEDLSVTCNLSGTAQESTDFTVGAFTIPAGSTTAAVALSVLDDDLVEGLESMQADLAAGTGYELAAADTTTSTAFTDGDAAQVAFAVTTSSTGEDDAPMTIDVTLSMSGAGVSLAGPVDVAVADLATGTATAASDYAFVPQTLTFSAGATGGVISATIDALADDIVEGSESVDLEISVSSGACAVGAVATHSVNITETESATVAFSLAASTTIESAPEHNIEARLSTTPAGCTMSSEIAIDVIDATTGTATLLADCPAVTAPRFVFPAGSADGATALADFGPSADDLVEGEEVLHLGLAVASGLATIGAQDAHAITLMDADVAEVRLSASTLSVSEADPSPALNAELVITPTSAVLASHVVAVLTDLGTGTAVAGTDYSLQGSVGFAAGSGHGATVRVTFAPIDDTAQDGDLTVEIELTSVSNGPAAISAPAACTLTIREDELFDLISTPFPAFGFSMLSWGDLDGDGNLDLAMAGSDSVWSAAKVFLGDGGGAFSAAGVTLPRVWDGGLEWADVDNDGDMDLAMCGNSDDGTITRIYANAAGVLTDTVAGCQGIRGSSLDSGDIDGDGRVEIVAVGYDDTLGDLGTLYWNRSSGFVSDAAGIPASSNLACEIGELTGSGTRELALLGDDSGVYEHDGSSFAITRSLPALFDGDVSWGDYDADGDLDLAVAGRHVATFYFLVLENDDGVLNEHVLPLGMRDPALAWGDLDNDGDLDLVAFGATDLWRTTFAGCTFINLGGNRFVEGQHIASDIDGCDLALADMDNDGDLDFVVTGNDADWNGHLRVYRNMVATTNEAPAAPVPSLGTVISEKSLSGTLVFTSTSNAVYAQRSALPSNPLFMNGQTTVSGAGFDSFVTPGDVLRLDADGTWYEVASVTSDTSLELVESFAGATGTGPSSLIAEADRTRFAEELVAGDELKLVAAASYVTIASIESDYELLLSAPYAEATASGPATAYAYSITLTWAAPADDHTPSAGLGYNVRIGLSAGSNEVISGTALADGTALKPDRGNIGPCPATTWSSPRVSTGTYHVGLQAIDGAFIRSAWGEASITVP